MNILNLRLVIKQLSSPGYFNYEVPATRNEFFPDNEPGMNCNCPQECDHIEYKVEIQPDLGM